MTYSIDPDGDGDAKPFSIDNLDFNFKSLRGNAVLRWEYSPGSVFFLAWTQDRSQIDSGNGSFNIRDNSSRLLDAEPDNIILAKFSYWWNP